MHILITCEQTLVKNEDIRIQTWKQDIWTPHRMGNTMIPSFVTTAKLSSLLKHCKFSYKMHFILK